MDAFQLLKKDHQKVRDLFEELAEIEASDTKNRKLVFDQIKLETEIHAQLEEEIFYPALADESETAELIEEAYKEHKEVKRTLQKLDKMDKNTEEWAELCGTLQENIELHVEEEESEIFKRAKEVLTAEGLRELGKQLQLRKEELLPSKKEAPSQRRAR